MARVALCVDSESAMHPQLIGLDGEAFDGIEWLSVYSDARAAREGIACSGNIDEAWVVSCDDMHPIILAAALRQDNASLRVLLVMGDANGSSLSRAQAAGLTGTLTTEGLQRRYAAEKRRRLGRSLPCVIDDVDEADFAEVGFLKPSEPQPLSKASAVQDGDCAQDGVASEKTSGGGIVLSVVSAGGGTGKSALAVALALLCARRGLRTVLLDGDLAGGDSARLSGIQGASSFEDVAGFSDGDPMKPLPTCPSGYAVVSAPERIEVGEALRGALPQVIRRLSAAYEVVVVNADAEWGERKVALLEASTHVVCLVGQRVSSVRLAQQVVSLCARCGVAASMEFALNRCSKDAPFSTIDVSCALQGRRVFELPDGGSAVEELLGVGLPDALVEEENPFFLHADGLLAQMLPEETLQGGGSLGKRKARKRGFFRPSPRKVKRMVERGGGGYDDAA